MTERDIKCSHYLRYMDDFALFHNDADWLLRARESIEHWLIGQRHLQLGRKRWHVHRCSEPSVFLGYRVSRAGLSPSRAFLRRMKARLKRKRNNSAASVERSVASYRGWVDFC